MNGFLIPFLLAAASLPAVAQEYPDIFIRGAFNGWSADQAHKLSREGNVYSIHLDELDGNFKLASSDWNTVDLGASATINNQGVYPLVFKAGNISAQNLTDVTLSFTYEPANYAAGQQVTNLYVTLGDDPNPDPFPQPGPNPDPNPTPDPTPQGISGTLPVLYINVYTDSSKTQFNNEIISKDLDHKNYFSNAEYRLDVNGCQWLIDLGAENLGSADEMLPLEIKARGNWTRRGFAKKPFKLKLGKKASMLGMTKSKHYAILAHADDDTGYLKNFTGFNLGKRMGLPWTPGMQPVEVVINGDYRGLYFLTESIRVGDDRVMITELNDNETDSSLASGGYLVELDNYDEENQIRMEEKTCTSVAHKDVLRVTFDTPEEYSEVQKRFITDQFTAMNNAVGANSDDLWKMMDLDDAARYYVVEEIISHYEAYHGSTYLFRDFGEGQKWHFSPLWDCGNAFRGQTNKFFYDGSQFGNTWIPSMRQNSTFNNKVKDSWLWFMSNRFDGIYEDIDLFASRVQAAAEADYKRWNNVAPPSGGEGVADNRNMTAKAEYVKNHLRQKISWLKNQFGDFTAQTFTEPERDNREAAPLPDYVKPNVDPTPIDPTPTDPTTMPEVYVRGDINGWNVSSEYKMTYENETYTIHLKELNGKFKLASADWNTIDFGAGALNAIDHTSTFPLVEDGGDFVANNLRDVTLSFPYLPGMTETTLTVTVDGGNDPNPTPDPIPGNNGISGTLPVLYINVYTDATKTQFNNEIISKDLDHKNYFSNAEYRLDVNGCQWLIDLGAENLGSADEMLPLEIKARGNWTRKGFAKKPFKLKLGKKASMLGMTKSKHYAILAHADDDTGYLKNFTGFNLGKRMGLPWTPGMQPVEVVINGDYRGLYFLTESIRVGDDRVMITELNDNETDSSLASGGYLVELDNYEEENQIRMAEKTCTNPGYVDMLRITFDTPEEYSEVQKRFITDQFTAMNNAVGANSDDLWKMMDLDDAARYYVVEEIISHYEAYHGSTYLFRDFGEGQKWHFSPLWDCGNAFRGPTDGFFYNHDPFGNTWIPSMRCNATFNNKVKDSWLWFMSNRFDGIYEDIDLFASRVQAAAEADYKRWNNVAPPSGGQGVADNRNMTAKAEYVKNHLRQKISWLKNQFGDFTAQTFAEPERDNREAAPLPEYVKPKEDPTPIDPTPSDPPVVYLRAESNSWNVSNEYKFTLENDTYTLHLDRLDGKFKIASEDWKSFDFGASGLNEVNHSSSFPMVNGGSDFIARNLYDVTLSFPYTEGMTETTLNIVTVDPVPTPETPGISGSLPVLYINVYTDDTKSQYDNEIISKDLDHKNYFSNAEYRLDVNGCQWLIDLGAENLGSADEMLPLEIKARGNWTRIGFAKKPFKLKLGKKASMLGMTKSKHYAILAHADDETGYLKNFTGFNLGKRMGLPWTPDMQPVEVVINGDYRGLYFLTESIRVGDDRVMIKEQADNETDGTLASGGYLVELDNYDEENQIRMQEKVCTYVPVVDYLRVTFDTPEEYSDIQRRFIEEQFSAMNDSVGNNSDGLWRYLDLDDAARYYLVEEIISHYEAYHGSTYLFRDYGEGEKWHFSPLWDCGNAFRAPTNCFFYEYGVYGNTWIPSMRCNNMFNKKVEETWMWFMTNKFDGLFDDIDAYAERLKDAAAADYKRWNGQPTPNGGQGVADNRNMTEKAEGVKNHLTAKINWLRRKFGNYAVGVFPEPERDTTPAMPLPDYVKTENSGVENVKTSEDGAARYFNLQGVETAKPQEGLYIEVKGGKGKKKIRK